jgi:hypothetical protein
MTRRVIFLSLFLHCFSVRSQCAFPVHAFKSGEVLNFNVSYNWGLIWLESATATFKVESAVQGGKKAYRFTGTGSTYPKHDWFFKVRDTFEATVDSASFRPLKFTALINEGGKHDRHTYLFDSPKQKAYTIITRGTKKTEIDTLDFKPCSIDVLTAIYYARNIDYSTCRINDTIGISVLLDGKVFPLYVRYLGKENYTSELYGTYRCIKFRPLLVEGSIFKKGEHMTVWVTDDRNKIPLYIETDIIVGSIKVSLRRMSGIKYPLEAKITPDGEH